MLGGGGGVGGLGGKAYLFIAQNGRQLHIYIVALRAIFSLHTHAGSCAHTQYILYKHAMHSIIYMVQTVYPYGMLHRPWRLYTEVFSRCVNVRTVDTGI
jgi:hypothetical protein